MSKQLSVTEFIIFTSLGGIGTVFHYVVLVFCVQIVSLEPVTGSLAGYAVGALTNFLLSHHVAFRSPAKLFETGPRFATVALAGFFLNGFFMWSLVDQIGMHYMLAQILSTLTILCFNYFANATWTFGGHRRGS